MAVEGLCEAFLLLNPGPPLPPTLFPYGPSSQLFPRASLPQLGGMYSSLTAFTCIALLFVFFKKALEFITTGKQQTGDNR